jgi:hypothetical protein
MEDIGRITTCSNPLQLLFGIAPCEHYHFAIASRFHLVPPQETCRAQCDLEEHAFTSSCSISVRVLECAREMSSLWWTVLLPGRGKAWVYQDDVTPLSIQEVSTHISVLPTIGQITFSYMDAENSSSCASILTDLPCTVESVKSTSFGDQVEVDDWCYGVLTLCPRLKRLFVPTDTQIETLGCFVELAERGTCQLEVLVVGSCVHFQNFGLIEFLNALADVNNPLAKHLCELELNLIVDDDNDNGEEGSDDGNNGVSEFISAVQNMLDRSRRLHTVTFVFENVAFFDVEWYDEEIAIQTAPLALRSKLALLSVIATANTTMETAAGRLDTSVLTIIFQFAAQHRMRQVYTTTETP